VKLQFSLRNFLLFTAVAGGGVWAIVSSSEVALWITAAGTWLLLAFATLWALMRGRSAAFAIGFAAAGWLFLTGNTAMGRVPLTYVALNHLADRWIPKVAGPTTNFTFWAGSMSTAGGTPVFTYAPPPTGLPAMVRHDERIQRFIAIGHSLLALLVGAAGGVAATLIGRGERGPPAVQASGQRETAADDPRPRTRRP
jgi:hypothetical protein